MGWDGMRWDEMFQSCHLSHLTQKFSRYLRCFNGFDMLNQTHMVELVKFDVPAISLISSSTWVDAVIGVWHTLLSSFWFGASHQLLAVLADSSKIWYKSLVAAVSFCYKTMKSKGCCDMLCVHTHFLSDSRQVAKLVVEFWPKEPGVYPCTVTLTSDVDIRIYQFEGMRDLSGSWGIGGEKVSHFDIYIIYIYLFDPFWLN